MYLWFCLTIVMKRFANLLYVVEPNGDTWVNESGNMDLMWFLGILVIGTGGCLYGMYIVAKYSEIAEEWDLYMDKRAENE